MKMQVIDSSKYLNIHTHHNTPTMAAPVDWSAKIADAVRKYNLGIHEVNALWRDMRINVHTVAEIKAAQAKWNELQQNARRAFYELKQVKMNALNTLMMMESLTDSEAELLKQLQIEKEANDEEDARTAIEVDKFKKDCERAGIVVRN